MLLPAFPFFWLLASGVTGLIWVAMILAIAVAHGAMYGPTAALYAEMFGAGVRYTGTSLGYQLGGVGAGFVPIAAGALVSSANGASWPVALLWMAAAAVGVIAVALTKETRGNDLLDVARVGNTRLSKVLHD
jgi:MHS family shikimate/dehydroshikimate transporter-like MFS transporter